ncbi:MAG: hypothetical protein A2Y07_11740 [Planctomycetes bacterium GWF2_50_10]|nr:MAG: hypothetical protein A2Y07_11740 [Planctomycetes bacterium GWF2_50_10]
MGWMHDTLHYFSSDPVYRKYMHNELTFSIWYAFFENFVLALSHDEVVHGKGSLMGKMAGDDWQKFANLRLLLSYMYAHPGKKLLFMGMEFGQWSEWDHDRSLDWHLLQYPQHQGVHKLVGVLNHLYKSIGAMHEVDFDQAGFQWLDLHDVSNSVLSFLRKDRSGEGQVVVVCNFTPVVRHNYRLGVPRQGFYREMFNSDSKDYGGSGQGNMGGVESRPVPFHGLEQSISMSLPPLGAIFFEVPAVINKADVKSEAS